MAEEDTKELDAIVDAFDTAFWNGFGFQGSGVSPVGSLVVAFLFREDKNQETLIDETALTKQLRDEFNTSHIEVDDFCGRTFLKVHWTLYDKIPEILQFLLDTDIYGFCLQSTLDVGYAAGSRFNPLLTEKRFAQRFRERVNYWKNHPITPESEELAWVTQIRCSGVNRKRLFCRFNWQTNEGKAFCEELHRRLRATDWGYDPQDEERYNYFKFAQWNKTARQHRLFQYCRTWWWGPRVEPSSHDDVMDLVVAPPPLSPGPVLEPPPMQLAVPPVLALPPPPRVPTPPPLCTICLDQPANTLVMPCGHSSVCLTCSNKLAEKRGVIPDATVCVSCRQPFSAILFDGSE